jgi:hypothetical protein
MTDHKMGTREEWLAAPLELTFATVEITKGSRRRLRGVG